MPTLTYTTIDKSSWGSGPWQTEPDKIQWTDKATGLPCIARRAGALGHWCGYVGVSSDHLLYEEEDPNEKDQRLEVHGGITHTGKCQENVDEAIAICHKPEPGQSDNVWWFGFDCGHWQDLSPGHEARMKRRLGKDYEQPTSCNYRDLEFVKKECTNLAQQLKAQEIP